MSAKAPDSFDATVDEVAMRVIVMDLTDMMKPANVSTVVIGRTITSSAGP